MIDVKISTKTQEDECFLEKKFQSQGNEQECILDQLGKMLYAIEQTGVPFITAELFEEVAILSPFRIHSRYRSVFEKVTDDFSLMIEIREEKKDATSAYAAA